MYEEIGLLLEQVLNALEHRDRAALRALTAGQHPADLALLLQELPAEQAMVCFRLMPKETGAEVFANMEPEDQLALLRAMTDSEVHAVMEELYLDDAADLLEELPANVVARVLRQTEPETRKALNALLQYPEDSAGSVMTTEYVRLGRAMTVAQAFDQIRATGPDKKTIYTCYVTAPDRKLEGVVSVRELLLARPEQPVEQVMNPHVIAAETGTDREQVVQIMAHYDLAVLPVTDREGRLVGIVTHDDAMDVLMEEAAEDMEVMAAITPSEKPYLQTGVLGTWLQRAPWLLLLMVSSTFTGAIIASFEQSLAAIPALIAFIPMLMGTGGNAGGQSSATVIRGISMEGLTLRDLPAVLWKEARVAALCGLALGAVNLVKIALIDNLLLGSGVTLPVALVVSATLAAVVLVAKTVGSALPILTRQIGLDPAVMASPFITTIVDAVALLIYFRLALTFLDL